jgi:hypothetical protein
MMVPVRVPPTKSDNKNSSIKDKDCGIYIADPERYLWSARAKNGEFGHKNFEIAPCASRLPVKCQERIYMVDGELGWACDFVAELGERQRK